MKWCGEWRWRTRNGLSLDWNLERNACIDTNVLVQRFRWNGLRTFRYILDEFVNIIQLAMNVNEIIIRLLTWPVEAENWSIYLCKARFAVYFRKLAPLESMRYLIGKTGYIHLLPADSRPEKFKRFVIIMGIMRTEHIMKNCHFVTANWHEQVVWISHLHILTWTNLTFSR